MRGKKEETIYAVFTHERGKDKRLLSKPKWTKRGVEHELRRIKVLVDVKNFHYASTFHTCVVGL